MQWKGHIVWCLFRQQVSQRQTFEKCSYRNLWNVCVWEDLKGNQRQNHLLRYGFLREGRFEWTSTAHSNSSLLHSNLILLVDSVKTNIHPCTIVYMILSQRHWPSPREISNLSVGFEPNSTLCRTKFICTKSLTSHVQVWEQTQLFDQQLNNPKLDKSEKSTATKPVVSWPNLSSSS